MPDPAKLERLPPETEISDSMKSEQDSERVNVRVAVSPALREETSELTAMVGEEESLVEVSEACVAALPAKSLTSAVMVSVPSFREERSRPVTE